MKATNTDSRDVFATRTSLLLGIKDHANRERWDEFYHRYHLLVRDFARRYNLNEEDAQDAVQETFITVARKIGHFNYDPKKGRFRNWLLTISKYKIAALSEKNWRRQSMERSATPEDPAVDEMEVADPAVEETMRARDRKEVLDLIMRRLKMELQTRDFQIFDLNCVRGWNAKEVSEVLQVSRSQVYVSKHWVYRRACRLMREMVENIKSVPSKK